MNIGRARRLFMSVIYHRNILFQILTNVPPTLASTADYVLMAWIGTTVSVSEAGSVKDVKLVSNFVTNVEIDIY